MSKNVSLHKITVLAFISFLAITLITLFKNALELEDAEQAFYSQWLRLGYDDQPPLYTWLQYGLNKVLGVNRISFSVFRGILFAAILLLLYKFSAIRIKNEDKSKLVVLMLVLVPVFIDFTFRRLSHTSFLSLALVVTYYNIQLLIGEKTIMNYLLLGICIGVGLLSKYNYVFFLITFFVVSIWDRELRATIWNPKILLSILVIFLMITPHIYWLIGPEGYQTFLMDSIQKKIGTEENMNAFSMFPIVVYLKGFASLTLVIVIVILTGYFLKFIHFKKKESNWLLKMLFAQFIILSLFFLVFQSQKVETRWLLPLFIPYAVLLLELVEFKNSKKIVKIGFFIFYAVIFIQTVRTPIEKFLKIPSSIHFGFQPVADKLSTKYSDCQWVLPNVTYAGNVRLLHPDRTVFSSDDYSLLAKNIQEKKSILVSIDESAKHKSVAIDSIIGFGKEKENLYFYID